MPVITPAIDRAATRRRLAVLARVRWLGVAFGLVQVATYRTFPYPEGIEGAGYAVVAGIAVLNLALHLRLRRLADDRLGVVAVVSTALDLLGIAGLVFLYAFDPISAMFVLLLLVPIEAALFFGLRGAMVAWVATAVAYVGREWYGTVFANPWETPSVTFRVGLLGLISLIVGVMARDLQHQREAAARALADARVADAWRARLVGVLAHDLRSPLAGARMGLLTLRAHRTDLSPEEYDRIVDAGVRQVDRMTTMTRDLLDMARADQGRLVLHQGPVRLRDVVTRALDVVEVPATGLHVAVPDDLELVADGDRLEQVVANLVGNAVRHGEPPIEVEASRVDGTVRLTVRDHGPGLPVSLRDHVFDAFATTDDGRSGVGLGTWVVAHLVELHGGRVTYEDASPGARFVVELPVDGVSGPPE